MPYVTRDDGSVSKYFTLKTHIAKTGDRMVIVFEIPDKPIVEMVMSYSEAQHFKTVLADLDTYFNEHGPNELGLLRFNQEDKRS